MKYLCVNPQGDLEIWEMGFWHWRVWVSDDRSVEAENIKESIDADIRYWGRKVLEEWEE
jgi:hypothetical protein